MRKKDASCGAEDFYMSIPSGVAYSIIAEAVNRFGVELVEKDITLPGSAKDEMIPRAWVLKGDKAALEKSKDFMAKKLQEQLKSFE
jgi:hypothetical protein